jgi:hypothetical protein
VVLGLGGAGLVAGGVTGFLAYQKKHTALDHCDASHACDDTGLAAARSFKTFSLASTIAFAAGGVGLAVGTALVLSGKPRSETRVGVVALPGGGGIGATGEF